MVNAPEQPDDPRVETLVDQGIINAHMAHAAVQGSWPGNSPTPIAHARAATPMRHASHRGGRSYPEPSDSELDPNFHTQHLPGLTPEQQETNARGAAVAHQIADLLVFKRDAIESGSSYAAARLRARQERSNPR